MVDAFRVAGVAPSGTRGIRCSAKGPVMPWREVQHEDVGEGMLTGHSIARDIMAFAKENPEHSDRLITETLKAAVLSDLHTDFDDDLEGRSYAAGAFLSDIVDFLIFAAQHVNFEAKFADGAAYAQGTINAFQQHKDEKRKRQKAAASGSSERGARRAAKEAIDKMMRGA